MIRKFKMKNLRNAEFIEFHSQTLAHVFDAGPEQLALNKEYDALKQVRQSMEDVFGKRRGSALTKKLEEADRRRDRLVTGARMYFESFTHHDDEDKVAAGKLLLKSIDRFGKNIPKMNYQEESATINGILRDWKAKKKLGEAIELLNGGDWKDALEDANKQFNTLYIQRIKDEVAIPKESVTSMKDAVAEAYEKLVKHIVSHATIAEDKVPYNKLIKVLNQNIKQYDLLLKKRSNSGKDNGAEEDDRDERD